MFRVREWTVSGHPHRAVYQSVAAWVRPYLGPEIGAFGSEIGPYKCSHRLPYPSARMSGDGPFSVLWEWISVLWEWISMLWLLWTCIGRVHVQLGCNILG